MFQLIVAVAAISLVMSLTLASIFFGGEAFQRARMNDEANAKRNAPIVGTEVPDTTPRQPPVSVKRTMFDNLRLGWGTSDAF